MEKNAALALCCAHQLLGVTVHKCEWEVFPASLSRTHIMVQGETALAVSGSRSTVSVQPAHPGFLFSAVLNCSAEWAAWLPTL